MTSCVCFYCGSFAFSSVSSFNDGSTKRRSAQTGIRTGTDTDTRTATNRHRRLEMDVKIDTYPPAQTLKSKGNNVGSVAQSMWVVHAVISFLFGVIGSSGSKDPTLQGVLQDNAALRKENADLREENAALRKDFADLRTAFRSVQLDLHGQLQDCCPCSDNTTVTTEAVVNPCWNVTSGDCVADLQCLTSPDYPQEYQDDATCEVDILDGWSG